MSDTNQEPLDLEVKRLREGINRTQIIAAGVHLTNQCSELTIRDLKAELTPLKTEVELLREENENLKQEVKRLKDNINMLIMKWAPLSEYTRDTLKVKVVLDALEDVLTSENYYAGE